MCSPELFDKNKSHPLAGGLWFFTLLPLFLPGCPPASDLVLKNNENQNNDDNGNQAA
jgi:hypothetical protein